MYHVEGMQVVHTQANMNENFPQEIVSKLFSLLFCDGLI